MTIKVMRQNQLPELSTMRPVTMDDLEAVVALLNACSIDLVGRAQLEGGEMRTEWESPDHDLATNTRAAFTTDGRLVGYAEVWDTEPHVHLYVSSRVHPEFRGSKVGAALGRWVEERARQAIPKAPPGTRVAMSQGVLSTDRASRDLLEKLDYQPVRRFFRMVIEMEAAPQALVPPGITIRPYAAGQEERAVLLALRDVFEDHWGHVDRPLDDDYQEFMHWIANDPRYDPTLWFVARENGEIAGVSLCEPRTVEDPEMGYVDAIGIRRPWRRRGLGLALLQHSFAELYRRGQKKVCLGVDAQSLTGANRLYEKAGMSVQRQSIVYEKELRPGVDLSTQSVQG